MKRNQIYIFNKKADKLIFALALIVLILLAPTLRVYHKFDNSMEMKTEVKKTLD